MEHEHIQPDRKSVSIIDYLVFFGALVLFIAIGVIHAFCKRKRATDNQEFLVGTRTNTFIPVSLSLCATTLSAISILGYPAEIYSFGTLISEVTVSVLIFIPLMCYLYLPTLYHLQLSTVYEYLERRFQSRVLRLLCMTVFAITGVMYIGVALFAPSVAVAAVVNTPVWSVVLLLGGCIAIYTTIGGFQAGVWIESLQAVILCAGLLCVCIKGAMNVGGLQQALEIAEENGRFHFLDFTISPFLRHTSLNIFFGQGVFWGGLYGTAPGHVTRFRSLRNIQELKKAVLCSTILVSLVILLACLCGLFIYSSYAGCDPITLGLISRSDQVLPFFVDDQLSIIPGIMGLFFASLFSGTMGACSGVINAVSGIIWQDFLKPISYFHNFSPVKEQRFVKGLVFSIATTGVGFGMLAGFFGNILQATLTIFGAMGSPVFAIFFMGLWLPFINKKGAISGLIIAQIIMLWTAFGGLIHRTVAEPEIQLSKIEYCDANHTYNIYHNGSTISELLLATVTTNTTIKEVMQVEWYEQIYYVSYLIYPVMGFVITLVVGVIMSVATGMEDRSIQELRSLLHPHLVAICLRKRRSCKSDNGNNTLPRDTGDVELKFLGRNDDLINELNANFSTENEHMLKNGR